MEKSSIYLHRAEEMLVAPLSEGEGKLLAHSRLCFGFCLISVLAVSAYAGIYLFGILGSPEWSADHDRLSAQIEQEAGLRKKLKEADTLKKVSLARNNPSAKLAGIIYAPAERIRLRSLEEVRVSDSETTFELKLHANEVGGLDDIDAYLKAVNRQIPNLGLATAGSSIIAANGKTAGVLEMKCLGVVRK